MNKLSDKLARRIVFYGCMVACTLLLASCSSESADEGAYSPPSPESFQHAGVAIPSANAGETATVASIDRKIIYEAQLELVVRDFSTIEKTLPGLVKDHGGYLARVSIDQTSGEHRFGSWQARIPVAQFDAFQDEVSKLGIAESRGQTAQDVTEEFVDLEARISNKQRLEKRILDLLEDTKGKLTDIIEVENELARVRGEIEQLEGRLRYLSNRTDLTTVDITAREQRDYVPPETPTFLSRTAQSWSDSLLSLRTFAENFAVAFVYAFPWLLSLLVFGTPVIWLIRRFKNQGSP